MEYSYDKVIQDFYIQYQNGFLYYRRYKNCFCDFGEYQDLVSTIYLRFHKNGEKRQSYKAGRITNLHLRAEFRKAIRNGAIDVWRANKRRNYEPLENFEEYVSLGEEQSSEESMIAREFLEDIHETFKSAGLTEQETAIFLEINYCGSSQMEVALKFEITDRTVRNKLKSAYKKLRK